MTCKDCIYYEVCKALNKEFKIHPKDYIETDLCAKQCTTFKDKSKFIELPYKVGDKVYYFDTAGNIYSQTIHQFIYGGTGLKCDSDVMFDSELIGKRFFLTKEEAEQALREREND